MFEDQNLQNNVVGKEWKREHLILFFVLTLITFILFYLAFWSAPKYFPVGTLYDLKYGETLSSASVDLQDKGIIRSKFWFKSFVYLFSLGDIKVVAGDYLLYKKQNVLSIARRVSTGMLDTIPLKITIPEGLNSSEVALIFSKNMPSFDKVKFIDLVKSKNLEGYIFPDTYFFMPSITEEEIIKTMSDNFNERIKTVESGIKSFGKSTSDVIKMASIIEGEARTHESRKIVAGILWKRITLKMALQVDSSFKYINGKTTKDLSMADLKIDSPYNSYLYRGLPPTPISNPGLASIMDTITPTKTPYLYFLTDSEGNMHYAVTLKEHALNKQKYLK